METRWACGDVSPRSRVHCLGIFTNISQRPGFGEELIMIAFWESELEGREVFYHSITKEDTGEDVSEVSARITVA